jgi:hypothetical protein
MKRIVSVTLKKDITRRRLGADWGRRPVIFNVVLKLILDLKKSLDGNLVSWLYLLLVTFTDNWPNKLTISRQIQKTQQKWDSGGEYKRLVSTLPHSLAVLFEDRRDGGLNFWSNTGRAHLGTSERIRYRGGFKILYYTGVLETKCGTNWMLISSLWGLVGGFSVKIIALKNVLEIQFCGARLPRHTIWSECSSPGTGFLWKTSEFPSQ